MKNENCALEPKMATALLNNNCSPKTVAQLPHSLMLVAYKNTLCATRHFPITVLAGRSKWHC